MGIAGLDWQTLPIALSGGLSQRGNQQTTNPPSVGVLRDAEFDDIGGLRTRKPFAAMSNAIVGGGTITNGRRLIANGDELVLLTADSLYSWSPQQNGWVLRDEHLAVAVDETDVFAVNDDQSDCDRAQLGNVIVYAYKTAGGVNSALYVAARDATTGTTILSPTNVHFPFAGSVPRLIALQTRILMLWTEGANNSLTVLSIDPANVSGSLVAPTFIVNTFANDYDVVKVPNADQAVVAYRKVSAYEVKRLSAAGATLATGTKARTCDGPIAISIEPTSTNAQIIRANGTNIQGDVLSVSTFADVTINQAIGTVAGTPVSNITCAHQSVQTSGAYRCYVFWVQNESAGAGTIWQSYSNWVDTAGTIGTAGIFIRQLALASRAFDHAGRTYAWFVFAVATTSSAAAFGKTQSQNVNLLYRDDGVLIAQCLAGRAAGFISPKSVLPGITALDANTYAFCATTRRIVNLGDGGKDYSARAPCDVGFVFDDDRARAWSRIGKTLYLGGSIVQQYDGIRIVEVGFLVVPYSPGVAIGPNSGAIADGTYAYKWTWRWTNAQGEVDRSSSPTVVTEIVFGHSGLGTVDLSVNSLMTTKKTVYPVTAEAWRTATTPTADSPFYLVTSQDPNVTTGTNFYVPNHTTDQLLPSTGTPMRDALADSALGIRQGHPENGGVLENLAPPPGSIMIANESRLFVAGIPEFPDEVWYSKQRTDGCVVAFNDSLRMLIPPEGGDITAMAIAHETLYVFRETALYSMPGDGFTNAGGGQNFGPNRQLSRDVGAVSQRSIAVGPFGVLFKSSKGWYVVDKSESVKYVGGDVSDYDAETVAAVHVVKAQHQARIVLSSTRMLVWDYLVDRWAEWTVADGIDAAIWLGQYVYLTSTGPKIEAAVSGANYGIDMETAWIKLNDLQGSGRIRRALILGEWLSGVHVRVRTAYDYEADGAGGWLYRDDAIMTPNNEVTGSPLQLKRGFSQQQCEAVKLRISVVNAPTFASLTTNSMAVLTAAGQWNATLTSLVCGVEGNNVGIYVAACEGTGVEIRDHQTYEIGDGWHALPYAVGIRCGVGCTVAQLEAAIRRSRLATVTTPSVNQVTTITNAGTTYSKQFAGGATNAAAGAGISFSGLALEVGIDKTLNRRLAAGQKG